MVDLQTYIEGHIAPEPPYLYRLWRATNVELLHGRMASGHLQGRLLKMLVQMIRPQYILEVGTFSGYSALCMAEGLESLPPAPSKGRGSANLLKEDSSDLLKEDCSDLLEEGTQRDAPPLLLEGAGGRLLTFEINDELEPFTRKWIEESPWADYVDFRIGDAITEAPKLGITFDMAFIDGDKRTYVETYEAVLPILRPGGFILADNTLWDGHVTDPAYDRDHQTIGIRRFNDLVAQDPRVETVILPLRDGLTILRKKEE